MIRRRSSTVKPCELTGRAVGIQPVHAAGDQPVDVTAELVLVDVPAPISGTRLGVNTPRSFSFIGRGILPGTRPRREVFPLAGSRIKG
jgi:hypothetical protein